MDRFFDFNYDAGYDTEPIATQPLQKSSSRMASCIWAWELLRCRLFSLPLTPVSKAVALKFENRPSIALEASVPEGILITKCQYWRDCMKMCRDVLRCVIRGDAVCERHWQRCDRSEGEDGLDGHLKRKVRE